MGRHKAPKQDPTIAIAVSNAKGSPVKAVCPGVSYDLEVSYPEERMNMVIASIGSLDGGKADLATAETKCPNRLVSPQKAGQPKLAAYKTMWAVPATAKGEATISVTSAISSSSAFYQSSLTLPVSKDCKAAAIATAAPGNKTETGAEAGATPAAAATAAPTEEPAAGLSPSPANTPSPSPSPAPTSSAMDRAGATAFLIAAAGGVMAAAMML